MLLAWAYRVLECRDFILEEIPLPPGLTSPSNTQIHLIKINIQFADLIASVCLAHRAFSESRSLGIASELLWNDHSGLHLKCPTFALFCRIYNAWEMFLEDLHFYWAGTGRSPCDLNVINHLVFLSNAKSE